MAFIITDGFDMYNGAQANIGFGSRWTFDHGAGDGGNAVMVAGRFGGQAVSMSALSANLMGFSLGMPIGTTFTIGVALRIPNLGAMTNSNPIFSLFNSVTTANTFIQNGWSVSSTGILTFGLMTNYNTGMGVQAQSLPGTIVQNNWHYVEQKMTIGNAGACEMRVDGAQAFAPFAGDTQAQGNNQANAILLQSPATGAAIQFDDLYINDTAVFVGERRVETLYASSNSVVGWTPVGAATNFQCVDETLVNGDTDYVQATAVGTRDLYGHQPLSSNPLTIDLLNAVSFGRKTDAATRDIQNPIQSAGVDALGGNLALPANYRRFDHIVELNPNGAIPWVKATADATLIGPIVSV